MTSKAFELARLGNAYSDGALSNRNMIINGAMQVAQRGTSATGITSGGYKTVDRFSFSYSTAGTWTISQSTDAPNGFANSLKMEVTTAQSTPTRMWIESKNEGYNLQAIAKGTSDAKKVTLSFWVKASVTGINIAELYDTDNTRQISKSYTIDAANTWEYKTLVFDADTSGVLSNNNGESLRLVMALASGSIYSSGTLSTTWGSVTNADRHVGQTNHAATVGNTFYITGVQLEVGDTATPFEHRSYGDQLKRCERYLQQWTGGGTYPYISTGRNYSSTTAIMTLPFRTEMRAAPTLTWSQYTCYDGSSRNASAMSLNGVSTTSTGYNATISGATTGAVTTGHLYPNGYLRLDAEL